MSFNQIGNILTLTTFGESHGEAIGGILDGIPSGVLLDLDFIQRQLDRRKPGQSHLTTPRKEEDVVHFLSGIHNGLTTGHSIGFTIPNRDFISKDYDSMNQAYRPSHADFTYHKKYGIRDPNGGGRSSARETANWVVAGACARHILPKMNVYAFVSSIGEIEYNQFSTELDYEKIDHSLVRCPDEIVSKRMIEAIEDAKRSGDSLGGTITCIIQNVPIGLGEPIFHKLEAELARAMMSLNACKGFEIGSGFNGTRMRGSQHNDIWLENEKTNTNHSGGIQGGISNGMDIEFRLAFKPTSTIGHIQPTIDIQGKSTTVEGKGRHDPCVLPRAVPIVEMLSYLVIADLFLLSKIRRFDQL